MQADPNTLIVDVRDAADIPVTGIIPGAVNISLGTPLRLLHFGVRARTLALVGTADFLRPLHAHTCCESRCCFRRKLQRL